MKAWAQIVCAGQTKEFWLGVLGALGFDLDDGAECTLSKISDYTNFEEDGHTRWMCCHSDGP